VDCGHHALAGRLEAVLHLHRLQDRERLAGRRSVARRHEEAGHLARHGCGEQRAGVGFLGGGRGHVGQAQDERAAVAHEGDPFAPDRSPAG
jgi:hypothetical protein